MRISFFLLMILTFVSCNKPIKEHNTETTFSPDITPEDIRAHINYLSRDSLHGRETGSAEEARAARYIADYFRRFGLYPAGDDSTYYQQFTVEMSQQKTPSDTDTSASSEEERISRNVIGTVKGSTKPNTYIIVSSHYDYLGVTQGHSLSTHGQPKVQTDARNNASGTSGMLELAQYYSSHRPEKSIIFVAFSGQESGFVGSQHFVDAPAVPLKKIQAIINMDMIGHLKNNKLIIFGTGTSKNWPSFIKKANTDSLKVKMMPDGAGGHNLFYNNNIPALHYFTSTQANYHHSSDNMRPINLEGEGRILEHMKRLIGEIDTLGINQLAFKKMLSNRQPDMLLNSPTLGVMPDYGFNGTGMRITDVDRDGPAYDAGLQSGDIIIRLDNKKLKDIYAYMDVLKTLEKGQETTVTVKRNNQKHTFDITL